MPTVRFEHSGTGAGPFRAAVDGVRIQFDNGAASKVLPPGEHALSWFYRAPPGTAYAIGITAPAANAWKHEQTMDESQLDAGIRWFTLAIEP